MGVTANLTSFQDDASNTPADRAANPTAYRQLSTFDGAMVLQVRNDLPREEAIQGLRQIADRLESMEASEGAF